MKKRGVQRDTSRDPDIIKRFKSGQTLRKIGYVYGISCQRVHQILKRYGITGKDGGQTIQGIETRKRLAEEKERKLHEIRPFWGCSDAVRFQYSKAIRCAYKEQRNNYANHMGVEWNLTLPEWWEIWEESGKWCQRGRLSDEYVMTRIDQNKGFSIDNCYITTKSILHKARHCDAMWG